MFLTIGFLSSYVNCAFDPLSTTCFGVLAMKLEALSVMLQKSSDLVSVAKYPSFSLLVPKTSFGLLATKLSCFEV